MNDRWTLRSGRIVINGVQAIVRLMLAQAEADRARGLRTAGYVSGYRGSPLGGVDNAFWSASDRLAQADIVFRPGVNEDLAATAVHGAQQIDQTPDPLYEGVFAAWYGKGPGVDRSCDAFKHGNYAGAHRNGGVVLFYGDDHAGKSSTVAHQSEQALAACLIPSLYPANVAELMDYGLLGFALSRFSGVWTGVKCVNEVVEQTAVVDVDFDPGRIVVPDLPAEATEDVHLRTRPFDPLGDEERVLERRLPLVHAFVRANGLDRTIFRGPRARLGLVTAGKTHGDTRAALELLGLDEAAAAALGVSLFKVGCIWPLEPEAIGAFADGHEVVFVIEEKKSFVEAQLAQQLINRAERPRLIGKRDEDGAPLLSAARSFEPVLLARALIERLARLGVATADLEARLPRPAPATPVSTRRIPYFCSGCPHSRSTRTPQGSLSMTGIGCHAMVRFTRPAETLPSVHMGGEGSNWIGLAPFTGHRHMFQNMGDGTYYHSGLLAIRAAIAAGVNITYKILYNDAVAMTGGQPVDGPLTVADIARQVRAEGVRRIAIVSDDPARRSGPDLPEGCTVDHRDALDTVQRELREVPGCSVLIYEQTCATEKRRRRKRGLDADPGQRLFIVEEVCEGCGDCSVQSTCVSLKPIDTPFGTKRAIDQSSCNMDYSCRDGFCPSFLTVRGARLRKPQGARLDPALFDGLPRPSRPDDAACDVMIAGIGGAGVVTIGAVLGMAAHLDGLAASQFDMTGLAQKNGAVYSHLRIAAAPSDIHAQRIGPGQADLLLAVDVVAGAGGEAHDALRPGGSTILANATAAPTAAFQFDREARVDAGALLRRMEAVVGAERLIAVEATQLAQAILGEPLGANMFMAGLAVQRGLLPLTPEAIEKAIETNGAAVAMNIAALRLGRLFAVDPEAVTRLAAPAAPPAPPRTLQAIIAHRSAHLTAYQNAAYAERYRALVERVRAAETAAAPGEEALSLAVARVYARVMAYKDEYEVARLLTSPTVEARLKTVFEDGGRISFNMAPPLLAGPLRDGRPRKREFGPQWRPLLRVLAAGKGLRGGPLDPFGWTRERRAERRFLADYEALVADLLTRLTADNHAEAVALASLADQVRGFGPVKEAAMRAYADAKSRPLAPGPASDQKAKPSVKINENL